jgi:coproporphyrinogen III oxidase
MTIAPERIGSANREAMARWTAGLHDVVTAMFERLDGDRLVEASWERKGGGGGQSRLLTEGRVFEKAGVNRALVEGILPPEAAARLGGNIPAGATAHFLRQASVWWRTRVRQWCPRCI